MRQRAKRNQSQRALVIPKNCHLSAIDWHPSTFSFQWVAARQRAKLQAAEKEAASQRQGSYLQNDKLQNTPDV